LLTPGGRRKPELLGGRLRCKLADEQAGGRMQPDADGAAEDTRPTTVGKTSAGCIMWWTARGQGISEAWVGPSESLYALKS
jgi:hypothetical protein